MRRTFPLLATIAAEVAAVFAGAPPAVADTVTPDPVAVAQPETLRAEPPAAPPVEPSADPTPAGPVEPGPVEPGPVETPALVEPEAPTATVRTGRAGDPAATATSLAGSIDSTPEASAATNQRRPVETAASAPSAAPTHVSDRGKGSTPITPVPAARVPVSVPPSPSAASMTSASSHVVVGGDNLWDIAAARLASVTSRDVAALSTAEIVRYWVRVCEDNRGRLRSGDVSLIYAGEIVELPAL